VQVIREVPTHKRYSLCFKRLTSRVCGWLKKELPDSMIQLDIESRCGEKKFTILTEVTRICLKIYVDKWEVPFQLLICQPWRGHMNIKTIYDTYR